MIDGMKPNFSALAKQFDCDYRTVKAAYREVLNGGNRSNKKK